MTNDEFFGLARHTIWRLETLPQYNPRTDEAFLTWCRTGELLPLEQRPGKRAWMDAVTKAVAAGKRVGRVRIHHGLQPYAAYELAVYPENAAAGEDVWIADLGRHPELASLTDDFWLMDDHLALLMGYEPDGQFRSMTPTSNLVLLAALAAARDVAVECSVPLAEYLALEPQLG
jgi:uncharacterized protein DUF6879